MTAAATVSIVQRGKMSFRVRTRWKDPDSGEVREFNETIRGTRAVAEAYKQQLMDDFRSGRITHLSAESAGVYLDQWVAHRAAMGEIKETTAQTYRSMLRNFTDEHGGVPLASLRSDKLKEWQRQCVINKGAHVAAYTGKVLNKAFAAAVKEGVMLMNPFDRLSRPKVEAVHKEHTLDAEQVKALWTASADSEHGLLVRLALETGLRRGELAALQWQDITWQGVIKVRKTAVTLRRGVVKVWAPKTKSSRRDVAVTATMRDELNALRGNPEDYLFGGAEPPNPNSVSYRLECALEQAGIVGFSAHDLRHAHATHLLRNKLPPAAVSKRLGHARTSITLDVYSHALADDDSAIVETMESVLR